MSENLNSGKDSLKTQVKITWAVLIASYVVAAIPFPTFLVYLPLGLVALILAIILMSKGATKHGVIAMLGVLFVPFFAFLSTVFLMTAAMAPTVKKSFDEERAKSKARHEKHVASQNKIVEEDVDGLEAKAKLDGQKRLTLIAKEKAYEEELAAVAAKHKKAADLEKVKQEAQILVAKQRVLDAEKKLKESTKKREELFKKVFSVGKKYPGILSYSSGSIVDKVTFEVLKLEFDGDIAEFKVSFTDNSQHSYNYRGSIRHSYNEPWRKSHYWDLKINTKIKGASLPKANTKIGKAEETSVSNVKYYKQSTPLTLEFKENGEFAYGKCNYGFLKLYMRK